MLSRTYKCSTAPIGSPSNADISNLPGAVFPRNFFLAQNLASHPTESTVCSAHNDIPRYCSSLVQTYQLPTRVQTRRTVSHWYPDPSSTTSKRRLPSPLRLLEQSQLSPISHTTRAMAMLQVWLNIPRPLRLRHSLQARKHSLEAQ